MVIDYETIGVSQETKKKFKQLKEYKQTDEEFLKSLIEMFENERGRK